MKIYGYNSRGNVCEQGKTREDKLRKEIKMLKRGIAIGMSVLMCLSFAGCTKTNTNVKPTEKAKVESTQSATDSTVTTEGQVVTDATEIKAMAASIVGNMTLEEKIGQMFIMNLEQLDTSNGAYYEFRECTDEMRSNLESYHLGGVILFSRNISEIDQTKKLITDLQGSSSVPLFVSVDEEGGSVARIGNNANMRTHTFPTMEEIGLNKNEEYAYTMGATIGQDIKELGFNLDFAPVADVKTNAYNTEIGDRSFGSDPDVVSKLVKQVVYGIQDQGISATLKHFPGHGSTSEDSHEKPVNADSDLLDLRSKEFKPFQEGINAGADFVMVSHISISKVTENTVPASMSKIVIQNMLRKELGFEGIIVTDAMDMGAVTKKYKPGEAAVNCVKAGVDIVLMSTDLEEAYDAVLEAVEKGRISEEQIDASAQRVLQTKIKRGIILSNTDLLVEE